MSANLEANGGLLRRPLHMPDFRDCAVNAKKPGATLAGNVPTFGNFLREVMRQNMQKFRVFGPDETQSDRLQALYDVTKKVWLQNISQRTMTEAILPRTAASWRWAASTRSRAGWKRHL